MNDVGVTLGHDLGLRPGGPGDREVREHSIQPPKHKARSAECEGPGEIADTRRRVA
jgi:hypothetical protein